MREEEDVRQRWRTRKEMDWSQGNPDFIQGYVFALEWVLEMHDGE